MEGFEQITDQEDVIEPCCNACVSKRMDFIAQTMGGRNKKVQQVQHETRFTKSTRLGLGAIYARIEV